MVRDKIPMTTKIQRVYAFWLVGVAVTVGLLSLIWLVPQYQANKARERASAVINSLDPKEQPKERLQLEKDLTTLENSARTTIAQIIGGLVVLLGLYFTYQNVKTAQQNLRVIEDGNLTDRFSKAVELLGSDKLDIRLGGIYALERIAKDSKQDHLTIMEILTAYVREHSPRKNAIFNLEKENAERIETPPTDINVILNVISRRKRHDIEIGVQPVNLNATHLNGIAPEKTHVRYADFKRHWADAPEYITKKKKGDEARPYITGACLRGAEFRHAELNHSDLSGADLFSADLYGAILIDADLRSADLGWANIQKADLRGALLGGADLRNANLDGADLRGADLSEALMHESELIANQLFKRSKIDDNTKLPSFVEKLRKTNSV